MGFIRRPESAGQGGNVTPGILIGLLGALGMAVAYVCMRLFMTRRGAGTVRLLAMAHVIMAGVSAVLLAFVWPARMPPLGRFGRDLAGAAGFYLVAQGVLLFVLLRTDASRIAPLLSLKVLILAGIKFAFFGEAFTPLQWAAVGLTVVAAHALNVTGGRLPWRAVAGVLFACLGYSLSDLHVKELVDALSDLGMMRSSLVASSLCYVVCGLASAPLLLWRRPRGWRDWAWAAPYGLTWMAGIVFVFACFGMVDVVFGNIIVSTRGVFSILLGAAVARMGMIRVEQRVSPSVLLRRLAAAVMITLAIGLFVHGAEKKKPEPAPTTQPIRGPDPTSRSGNAANSSGVQARGVSAPPDTAADADRLASSSANTMSSSRSRPVRSHTVIDAPPSSNAASLTTQPSMPNAWPWPRWAKTSPYRMPVKAVIVAMAPPPQSNPDRWAWASLPPWA